MQVVVSKKELLRVLSRCQGVADKKGTMPVLGNVLLRANDEGSLELAATDLALAVTGRIAARVQQVGAIAVGARDILERVRMMQEGEIEIETNEGAVTTIRSAGTARRFTLHGLAADDFPALPQPDADAATLELDVETVARLIGGTHFSIATDESRLQLNSALFEWDAETVRMVTTDGHRLSKMEVTTKGHSANQTMLIPLKGISELRRLCDEVGDGDDEAKLKLSQTGPNAFFSLAGLQLSIKLVDSQFPPYQQVIPDASERAVRAPRLALADALRAVSVAASERTGGVKMTLSDGKLRFESENPESGAGFDEVPVDYQGQEVTLGFNARYFLDALSAIDDDEVVLGLSGELDPAIIKPATESANSRYLAVIMPMRI